MKTKLLFSFLILSLSINIAVISTVGYHYYRNFCMTPAIRCPLNQEIHRMTPAMPFPINQGNHHLYQSLGLSDSQLAKMAPLSKKFHTRLTALKSQVMVKRDLLIRLLGSDEIDHSRIEETRKEIAAIQDEIQREVVVHITQTKEILNPEQKKRFFEMLQDSVAHAPFNSAFPIAGEK
jgi:Spy/CpxP family protein refolding chaperone